MFADEFKNVCLEFLQLYIDTRYWEISHNLNVNISPAKDLSTLPMAIGLMEISRAAAGKTDHLNQGEVYDYILGLLNSLFTVPGVSQEIPQEFWKGQFGQMVALALMWAQGEELISLKEASEISGRSLSNLSQMVSRGKLTVYPDPTEPNPQKNNRVLRSEIENL